MKSVYCLVLICLTLPAWSGTLPDGKRVDKTPAGVPYCATGCDVAEDCRHNQRSARPNHHWSCQNKPGACIGTCVQQKN